MTMSVVNMTEKTKKSAFRLWLDVLIQSSDLGMVPVIGGLVVIWAVFNVVVDRRSRIISPRRRLRLSLMIIIVSVKQ